MSGLFTSMFSLGAFLGPAIGGSLVNVIGFGWSAFSVSVISIALAVVLSFYLLSTRGHCCRKPETFYVPIPGEEHDASAA